MEDVSKKIPETDQEPVSGFAKGLRLLVSGITKMNRAVGILMSYTLLLLLALMIIEVVRRYIFANPSVWGYDASLWIFGMPALLAGGYVMAERGHVNMDILYNKMSPRVKAILDCITAVAFFAFIVVMLVQCVKSTQLAIVRNEMSITNWRIKIWPVKIWMPVAAALVFLQGIADFICNLYMAVTGRRLMK